MHSSSIRLLFASARSYFAVLMLATAISSAACAGQDATRPDADLASAPTTTAAVGDTVTHTSTPPPSLLSSPPPTQPAIPTAPATSRPNSPAAPSNLEPTAVITVVPPTLTRRPTPTPVPTSSVVPGWLTYENKFLGYSFSYPPDARISIQGVTGFPTNELPENVTAEEYQAELEARYPDNLCVTVTYKTTFITFVPSEDSVGKYTVPCGVTGVGDYDVESNIESLIIGNVQMVGDTFWLSERDSGTWHGEFTMLNPHENVGIHFGSVTGTHEEFLEAQETMMQVVFSFRQE